MIVVDASALLHALIGTPLGPVARKRLFASGESLHAPHLIDLEVAQVVRRYVRAGDIDDFAGERILGDLVALPLVRHSHGPLMARVWDFRDVLSAYDAAYVALAQVLDALLVTRDRRLASAIRGFARVEML